MKKTQWILFLLAIGLTTIKGHADFLRPESVPFVSNGEDSADLMIDDFDLFDEPPTAESLHDPFGGVWSSVGSVRAEIIFALGDNFDLSKAYLWNLAGDSTAGMKDLEIAVSPSTNFETALFTTVVAGTLEEGGEEAQVIEFQATDVRLVRIKNSSNHGNGFTIGLAEVRFETDEIEGRVPFAAITNLADGDTILVGKSFEIEATVFDDDENSAKVEFFDGDTSLGTLDAAPYTLTVDGATLGEHTYRVQVEDAEGKVAWSTATVLVKEGAEGEIIQIDDTADEGDDLSQITYSDGWNLAQGNENDPRFGNNDHWSGTADASFDVKFSGVQIELYATVASHHGTATVSIDGGTEFQVSYTADQRAEQALVWTSPELPNREHVLRVTVNGDGVVTADRFDVTSGSTQGFQISNITYQGGANPSVRIEWSSSPGQTFTVERSSSLGSFEELTDGVESGGESTTFVDDSPPESEAYYRVNRE